MEIKASMKAIDGKLNSIEVSVAKIEGKVSHSPTWLQLISAVLARGQQVQRPCSPSREQ